MFTCFLCGFSYELDDRGYTDESGRGPNICVRCWFNDPAVTPPAPMTARLRRELLHTLNGCENFITNY